MQIRSSLPLPLTPVFLAKKEIPIHLSLMIYTYRDSREITLEVLSQEPEGAFMVRESTSKPGCYALSLRVPREFQPSGIAHYLIMRTNKGYKIKVSLPFCLRSLSLPNIEYQGSRERKSKYLPSARQHPCFRQRTIKAKAKIRSDRNLLESFFPRITIAVLTDVMLIMFQNFNTIRQSICRK